MMAYITIANTNKIIYDSDLKDLDLTGEIYRIPIYFFNKYEEKSLLAIQELLKDPERYFDKIYKPYKPKDTYTLVYEGGKPAYHKYKCCPTLNSDYHNFPIPEKIKEKGKEAVEEFREWFKTVEHLLDKPDILVMRLKSKYGIETNPKAINKDNSGFTQFENVSLENIETKINSLIKEAGRFYYVSEKNKAILRKYSKLAFLGFRTDTLEDNNTGYTDDDVKKLLRHFETVYKKPLKGHLIEYYRFKLNPEIKMEGLVLDNLGFKPCGHCHKLAYSPKEEKSSNKELEDDLTI